MATDPPPSQASLWVRTDSPTPAKAKARPVSAAESSSSTTIRSGPLARWMNEPSRRRAGAGWTP